MMRCRFRLLLSFLVILIAGTSRSRSAQANGCGLFSLQRDIQSLPGLSLAEFTDLFLGQLSPEADNQEFFVEAAAAASGKGSVVYVATGRIKLLADKVLQDREATMAIVNLFKRLLLTSLPADRLAGVKIYASYKGLSFASRNVANLHDQLAPYFAQAAVAFAAALRAQPDIRAALEELAKSTGGKIAGPASFFSMGSGRNFTEAALAQTYARYTPLINGGVRMPVDFTEESAQADLRERYSAAGWALATAVKLLQGETPRRGSITEAHPSGLLPDSKILSLTLMKVLRQANGGAPKNFAKELTARYTSAFGIAPPAAAIEPLRALVQGLEFFSPEILVDSERADLGIGSGDETVMMIDGRGVGARNLHYVMRNLALAAAATPLADFKALPAPAQQAKLLDFLAALDFGQGRSSARVEAITQLVIKALRRDVKIKGRDIISGDDLVYRPEGEFTLERLQALAQALQAVDAVAEVRITSVKAAPAARLRLINFLEGILKATESDGLDSTLLFAEETRPGHFVVHGVITRQPGGRDFATIRAGLVQRIEAQGANYEVGTFLSTP